MNRHTSTSAGPWVVIAPESPIALAPWLRERRQSIQADLLRHKAILYRGCRTSDGLESASSAIVEQRVRYACRSRPRVRT